MGVHSITLAMFSVTIPSACNRKPSSDCSSGRGTGTPTEDIDRRSTGSNVSTSSSGSNTASSKGQLHSHHHHPRPAPCWDLGYHSIESTPHHVPFAPCSTYEPVYQGDRLRGRPLGRSPDHVPAPSPARVPPLEGPTEGQAEDGVGATIPLPRVRSRRRWALSDPFPEDAADLHAILPRLRRQHQAGVLPDEEPPLPPPAPAPSAMAFVIGGGVSVSPTGPTGLPPTPVAGPTSLSSAPVPLPRTKRAAAPSPCPSPAPGDRPSPRAASPASASPSSTATPGLSDAPPLVLRSKSHTPEVKKKSLRLSRVFSSAVHLRSSPKDQDGKDKEERKREKEEERRREKEEERKRDEERRRDKGEERDRGSQSRERGRRLVQQLQRSLFGGSVAARPRSATRLGGHAGRPAHHGSCDLLAPTKAQVSPSNAAHA